MQSVTLKKPAGLGLPRRCEFCAYAPNHILLEDGRVVAFCTLKGKEVPLDHVCSKWVGEW